MDAHRFLRLVLDPGRLAVVGLVAAGPRTVAELVEASGLDARSVLGCLAPLLEADIVTRTADAYRLEPTALRRLATQLPRDAPPARTVMMGMTGDEQAVLARFFSGSRLREIPPSRGKRRVVLERVALGFEPGVRYTEAEVNTLLIRYHDDYVSLRRYLVDEGLLDREAGQYWRSGGRVE